VGFKNGTIGFISVIWFDLGGLEKWVTRAEMGDKTQKWVTKIMGVFYIFFFWKKIKVGG
jgi:hypothetical protein